MTEDDKLAEAAHEIWSHWMRYYYSLDPSERETKEGRWRRQMMTPYRQLSMSEQDSDKDVAAKYLNQFRSI